MGTTERHLLFDAGAQTVGEIPVSAKRSLAAGAAVVIAITARAASFTATGAASLSPAHASESFAARTPAFSATGAASLSPARAAATLSARPASFTGSGSASLTPAHAADSFAARTPAFSVAGAASFAPAHAVATWSAITPAFSSSGGPVTLFPIPYAVEVTQQGLSADVRSGDAIANSDPERRTVDVDGPSAIAYGWSIPPAVAVPAAFGEVDQAPPWTVEVVDTGPVDVDVAPNELEAEVEEHDT